MRQSLRVSAGPITQFCWLPAPGPGSFHPILPLSPCSGRQESFVPQDSGLFTPQAASKQSLPFVLKCCVGALVTHLILHAACSQNLGLDVDELSMWELAGLSEHLPLWGLTQRVPPVCPEVRAVGKFIVHYHWQCFCSPDIFQTVW